LQDKSPKKIAGKPHKAAKILSGTSILTLLGDGSFWQGRLFLLSGQEL
jgi:hypothetical protein